MGQVTMSVEGAVALVTLDNGPLNPITDLMRGHLQLIAQELASTRSVRCVVLTSSSRSFSVGSDLTSFPSDEASGRAVSEREHAAYAAWASLPQPVVAVLKGHTLGGGLELALVADLRVVEDDARLGLPEVRVGVFPSGGGTQRLPALIGAARAKHLMLLGETVDAPTALSWGLATVGAPPGGGDAVARRTADRLAALPPGGLRATKACTAVGLDEGAAAGHDAEVDAISRLYATHDAREGVSAFLAKRQPRFLHT